MTFDERENIIHTEFIVKMGQLYYPPKHVDTKEGKQLYGQELRKIINNRLSKNIPNKETFEQEVNKVWDRCCQANNFRVYFPPHLVAKIATQVNHEWTGKQQKIDATWERLTEPEDTTPEPRKDRPETMGWTIEKCDRHIQETQRLMDEGHLNKGFGNLLIQIPIKAKERLQQQSG